MNVMINSDLTEVKKNCTHLVDFMNFVNKNLDNPDNLIKDHEALLTNLINNVKNMGNVFILLDYYFLSKIRELIYKFIKNNPTTNLLLKIFLIEKTPLLGIFCIQKFEQKQSVILDKMQFLTYEVYNNNQLSQEHLVVPFIQFEKLIDYFTVLYSYQITLRKVNL